MKKIEKVLFAEREYLKLKIKGLWIGLVDRLKFGLAMVNQGLDGVWSSELWFL